jgi:PAS domain S-box-containing protein
MKFYNKKIKFLRTKERYSVDDFCTLIGVGRTLLWEWETAKKTPSEAHIRLLAKKLNVSVNEISDLEPEHEVSNLKLSELNQACLSFIDDISLKNKLEKQEIFIQNIRNTYKDINQASMVIKGLLNSITSIFYVKDLNLKYIIASKAFLENLSLVPSYLVSGKMDSDFYSVSESKENEKEDYNVLMTGKAVVDAERYIPGSRKKKWGLISKTPILDSNNRIAGLVGTFVDITSRKKFEEMRRLLEIHVNVMSDGLCIAEKETRKIIFVNNAIEKITGYPREKFISEGGSFWLEKCVHPDFQYLGDKLRTAQEPIREKYKIIRADGKFIWVEGSFSNCDIGERKCGITVTRVLSEE